MPHPVHTPLWRAEQLAVGPRPPQPPLGGPGWCHVGDCLGAACMNWVLAHFQKIAQGETRSSSALLSPSLLGFRQHCHLGFAGLSACFLDF